MRGKLSEFTKVLIAVFLIGLSLLLYPTVSNYWNSKHSTRAINQYVKGLENINAEEYERIWTEAADYNQELTRRPDMFALPEYLEKRYFNTLNPDGSGVMGFIEIPKLEVSLPVYHGTSDSVLLRAVGHIDWTSLPVGGPSTHCVVSGHRGLPSAKLFTDLDKLREGDTFSLNILNEVLTYEVDQIRTVLPSDVMDLVISEGKDFCTMVTCTPYGINTHRLLVRGHRIETKVAEGRVVSEAVLIDQLIVACVVAGPLILSLVLVIMVRKPESVKKKKKERLLEKAIQENLKKDDRQ